MYQDVFRSVCESFLDVDKSAACCGFVSVRKAGRHAAMPDPELMPIEEHYSGSGIKLNVDSAHRRIRRLEQGMRSSRYDRRPSVSWGSDRLPWQPGRYWSPGCHGKYNPAVYLPALRPPGAPL